MSKIDFSSERQESHLAWPYLLHSRSFYEDWTYSSGEQILFGDEVVTCTMYHFELALENESSPRRWLIFESQLNVIGPHIRSYSPIFPLNLLSFVSPNYSRSVLYLFIQCIHRTGLSPATIRRTVNLVQVRGYLGLPKPDTVDQRNSWACQSFLKITDSRYLLALRQTWKITIVHIIVRVRNSENRTKLEHEGWGKSSFPC